MPNFLTRPIDFPWDNALRLAGNQLSKAATLIMGRQRGGMTGGLTWGTSQWGNWRTGKQFDYAAAVGDPLGNSIVVACLNAICQAAPEPPPRVYQIEDDGEDTALPRHALQTLLRRPNPFMSWEVLMGYIVYSTHLAGNAYLWKNRSGAGRVVELWPLHPSTIEPAWPERADTRQWITHYDYKPDGDIRDPLRIETQDVVHLRLNMDPNNMRKGRSPLWAGFKHLFTDEEAAAFTGAMLRNFGVPGVILSPNPTAIGSGGGPGDDDVRRVKEQYRQSFGGENRGEPMVTGGPFNVSVVSFSPQQMNLDKLQLMPEARVCALLGVPPIVAGLMVGLEHATYNNTGGLREHFTESKMVPFWRTLEGQLSHSLVPDFGDVDTLRIGFDLSDVRALQEDMDAKYKRVTAALLAGGVTLDTYHQELGLPPLPNGAGNVIYLPTSVTPTDPADLLLPPEPAVLPAPANVPLLEDGTGAPSALPPPAPGGAASRGKQLIGVAFKATARDTRLQATLLRAREASASILERELAAYFRGLASRTVQRFESLQPAMATAGMSRRVVATKDEGDVPPSVLELLPDAEGDGLFALLRSSREQVGGVAFGLAGGVLDVPLSFDSHDPLVTVFLEGAGSQVTGILETTRTALAATLQEGELAGEGIPVLAKRVHAVVEETYKGRAQTVARTEVATSQNRATVLAYRSSGIVTAVGILDGDQFDDACRAVNGTTQSLEWFEANPIQHPNCTRAGVPRVRGD